MEMDTAEIDWRKATELSCVRSHLWFAIVHFRRSKCDAAVRKTASRYRTYSMYESRLAPPSIHPSHTAAAERRHKSLCLSCSPFFTMVSVDTNTVSVTPDAPGLLSPAPNTPTTPRRRRNRKPKKTSPEAANATTTKADQPQTSAAPTASTPASAFSSASASPTSSSSRKQRHRKRDREATQATANGTAKRETDMACSSIVRGMIRVQLTERIR